METFIVGNILLRLSREFDQLSPEMLYEQAVCGASARASQSFRWPKVPAGGFPEQCVIPRLAWRDK